MPKDDDRQSRRTVPPSPLDSVPRPRPDLRGRATSTRGEDPPPLTPPAQPGARESLQRTALRAPSQPEISSEERILQALAQTQQSVRRDAEERASAFEETLKKQIRSIVTTEVKHSVPPPPLPPPEKSMWAHIAPHLPATIAALGAVLVALSQSCSGATKAIVERLDRIEKKQTEAAAQATIDRNAQHAYDLHARWWTQDVLEKLDVKITDPLGAPDRAPDTRLEFWPVPIPDPHKQKQGIAAPRVQPKTPFPLPPALPDPK